jgi:hypothetical protein
VGRTHSPGWWRDPKDLVPQGDPETVVILSNSALVGLVILGLEAQTMLVVKMTPDEQTPLSCVETTEIYIAHAPCQSNPRRHTEEADGA